MRSGDRTVQAYVSSGPDLATATWTAATRQPDARQCRRRDQLAARRWPVARRGAADHLGRPTTCIVFVSAAFDGQVSSNGHIRATLGAGSITWRGWDNPGSPNAASEWQGPARHRAVHCALRPITRPGAIRSAFRRGGFIHHFSVDDGSGSRLRRWAVRRTPTRPRRGRTASARTRSDGKRDSPPWTTAVIDKTMANECKVLAFAPLASRRDARGLQQRRHHDATDPPAHDIGQPLTNLRYQKSGASGTWTNIPRRPAAATATSSRPTATINQNDWALVPVSTTAIYAFRAKAGDAGVDGVSYNAAGNTWSPCRVRCPARVRQRSGVQVGRRSVRRDRRHQRLAVRRSTPTPPIRSCSRSSTAARGRRGRPCPARTPAPRRATSSPATGR